MLFALKVIFFLIPVSLGSIPDLPAKSCREINKSEEGRAVSGKYWLDFSILEIPVLAYCHMETEGKKLKRTRLHRLKHKRSSPHVVNELFTCFLMFDVDLVFCDLSFTCILVEKCLI